MPIRQVDTRKGDLLKRRFALGQEKEQRQRLRITFAKGEEVKYISHLDMMRLWERALRRAQAPLLYSKGYNPRPKISIAAPLAVGFTGQREVMDLILERPITPADLATSVRKQLPSGITLVEVEEVYAALPSLQSQVRSAEYRVVVEARETQEKIEERLAVLWNSAHLPRERRGRKYDLRPLIEKLWLEVKREEEYVLGMRLRIDEQGTGRPDEVVTELGLAEAVKAIERIQLYFTPLAET
jgi:radical SAM-linked protein